MASAAAELRRTVDAKLAKGTQLREGSKAVGSVGSISECSVREFNGVCDAPPVFEDGDVDEIWQDTTQADELRNGFKKPPRLRIKEPQNPEEATRLLQKFRPSRMPVEDLKMLLQARANPNYIPPNGASPLTKVLNFGPLEHIGEMRDLLLEAGAVEDEDARSRWAISQRACLTDRAYVKRFHQEL